MKNKNPPQVILTMRVTRDVRAAVEEISGKLSDSRGQRVTMTDVMIEALEAKCKKEGVEWPRL